MVHPGTWRPREGIVFCGCLQNAQPVVKEVSAARPRSLPTPLDFRKILAYLPKWLK